MKTLFVLILTLASLSTAQVRNNDILGNMGQSIFLFGSAPNGVPLGSSLVNLDTAEIDTSRFFYELLAKPVNAITDTLGHVHMRCKDSTGTDSMGVRLYWEGNSRPDGLGLWAAMDSVSLLGASASSYVNATPTPIINSLGYMAIRFRIRNIKVSAVGLKSVCRDIVLNRRVRHTFPR